MRAHYNAYGDEIVDRQGYIATFDQNDITDDDIDFVERVFVSEGMQGRTTNLDEVSLTPLLDRVSTFDTEEMSERQNWSERKYIDAHGEEHDFKEYVEQFLAARSVRHPDFRLLEVLPVAPPWPTYMTFKGDLEALIERLVDDGHDLERVLRFEIETGHRQAVIDRLKQEIAERQALLAGSETVLA